MKIMIRPRKASTGIRREDEGWGFISANLFLLYTQKETPGQFINWGTRSEIKRFQSCPQNFDEELAQRLPI
jgi:hypothetical protein